MIEVLESRIAPAVNTLAIGDVTSASFIDPDGDVVTIHIKGTAGRVDVDDVGAIDGVVDNGERIGSIKITGASPDFIVTVLVGSTLTSNGIVDLGVVTANTPILAFNTVPDTAPTVASSNFRLESYTGPGFTAGGGLNVDSIVGDGPTDEATALQLNNLAAGATIHVRDGITGGIVSITGTLAGSIVAETVAGGTEWRVGSVAATGLLQTSGDFLASVRILRSFAGDVLIDGNATGSWIFAGGVQPAATLMSTGWNSVTVSGAFGGKLSTVEGGSGACNVAFLNGSMSGTAVITSSGNCLIDLLVSAVAPKARVDAAGNLTLSVNKSAFAGRFSAGENLTVETNQATISGQLSAGDNLQITAQSVVNLKATAADVNLSIERGLTSVNIHAGAGGISGSIGQALSNSKLLAATGPIEVSVGGNVLTSEVTGSGVTLNVGGNVGGSWVEGLASAVALNVGQNINGTEVIGRNVVNTVAGGNVTNLNFAGRGNSELLVNGNFKGTAANSGGTLNFVVIGNVLGGSHIAADEVRIRSTNFAGSVNAGALDFTATGSVSAAARIQAIALSDISNDDLTFTIGGDFAGRLSVAGDFTTGTGASVVVVEGNVLPTARISIGGSITGGAAEYLFAKAFQGVLQVAGDIDQDLSFASNVRAIVVGEQINSTITILGRIASITAGNMFIAIDAQDGTFHDARGTVTGSLDTGLGYGRIISTI